MTKKLLFQKPKTQQKNIIVFLMFFLSCIAAKSQTFDINGLRNPNNVSIKAPLNSIPCVSCVEIELNQPLVLPEIKGFSKLSSEILKNDQELVIPIDILISNLGIVDEIIISAKIFPIENRVLNNKSIEQLLNTIKGNSVLKYRTSLNDDQHIEAVLLLKLTPDNLIILNQ
jgi:hypothetical protein